MSATMQELMAYAACVGRVQEAAERATTLVELQDAIRAALTRLHAEQPTDGQPAGGAQ